MDEITIRNIVKDEIQRNKVDSAYGVQLVPYHIHNNTDSPQVVFTDLGDTKPSYKGFAGYNVVVNSNETGLTFTAGAGTVYTGYVNSDGTENTPMPTGWTSTRVGSGDFEVTHNLGTTGYTIVGGNSGSYVMTRFDRQSNTFRINMLDRNGSLADSAFFFLVTVI